MPQTNSLADWLTYFETLHPVGIDMGLSRVERVWQNLCDIHHIDKLAKQKVITVAGTNGKGSACKMLSQLLTAQGYRVGMYTSPHIHHFRERVQINDQSVDDDMLIRAFTQIEKARGDISISYFEATTLVGLLCFAWEAVDFAVLEVGLGGRLDAINIIDADAVIITSIGLDHEAYLGNDLSQIALEKVGVCRPNAPCVYAQTDVYDSVVQFSETHRVPLLANGRDYTLNKETLTFNQQNYTIPPTIAALGKHQQSNCAGVLVLLITLDLLPSNYHKPLAGFSLAGRLEKIASQPDIFVDVAHNQDSARALAQFVQQKNPQYQHIYAVIGMLKDKDHQAVFSAINDIFDGVYLGCTKGERGFSDSELLLSAEKQLSCPITPSGSLENALSQAKQQAKASDLIVAFGSFLVVQALT